LKGSSVSQKGAPSGLRTEPSIKNTVLFQAGLSKGCTPGHLMKEKNEQLGKEVVVICLQELDIFSINMAAHAGPKKIISIDLKPESFAYLKGKYKVNHFGYCYTILGDAPVHSRRRSGQGYMGFVGSTHHYWNRL
jgi:hypothetical protein